MKAAVLITSGTVTKKPARNRRRSHWTTSVPHEPHDGDRGERQPIGGKNIEAVAGEKAKEVLDRQVTDHRRHKSADRKQRRAAGWEIDFHHFQPFLRRRRDHRRNRK